MNEPTREALEEQVEFYLNEYDVPGGTVARELENGAQVFEGARAGGVVFVNPNSLEVGYLPSLEEAKHYLATGEYLSPELAGRNPREQAEFEHRLRRRR